MAGLLHSCFEEHRADRERMAAEKGFLSFEVYVASMLLTKLRDWDKGEPDPW